MPTVEEIAERIGVDAELVTEALVARPGCTGSRPRTGRSAARRRGISLGDLVGADDPRLQTVVDRAALRPLISTLDERDRQILMPRFFQGSASARSRPAWATPRCTPPGC